METYFAGDWNPTSFLSVHYSKNVTCIEERKRVRPKQVNWRPCLLSQLFLIAEETCVVLSIYHDRKQAAREKLLVMPQEKERKDRPMEMTLKIDPVTCLLLGWSQNIQCFNLVTTRFSSPSMTRWRLQGGQGQQQKNPHTLQRKQWLGKVSWWLSVHIHEAYWGQERERRMSMHHPCPCFLGPLTQQSLQET